MPSKTQKRLSKSAALKTAYQDSGDPIAAPVIIVDRDAERASCISAFQAVLAECQSVPIRAISGFKPKALSATGGSYNGRSPTIRQSRALQLALQAQGLKLADGVILTRIFSFSGINSAIENGAGNWLIGCGYLKLVPGSVACSETFQVRSGASQDLISRFGPLPTK